MGMLLHRHQEGETPSNMTYAEDVQPNGKERDMPFEGQDNADQPKRGRPRKTEE